MAVFEVWLPHFNYPIKTKNLQRTINKLKQKGYSEEDVTIVIQRGFFYYSFVWKEDDGIWQGIKTLIHPIYAGRQNICNAIDSCADFKSLKELQEAF